MFKFFRHTYFNVKNPEFEPQKQERKNDHSSIIFGAKNKARSDFIWEKLMKFFVVPWSFEELDFFSITYQKFAFTTLILSKFQSLNANLWSIYSKRFEFMVYTFICAFWKIIFFWLLRPSKSSGALKKDSTFGFLTFGNALKNKPWINLLKALSCV